MTRVNVLKPAHSSQFFRQDQDRSASSVAGGRSLNPYLQTSADVSLPRRRHHHPRRLRQARGPEAGVPHPGLNRHFQWKRAHAPARL